MVTYSSKIKTKTGDYFSFCNNFVIFLLTNIAKYDIIWCMLGTLKISRGTAKGKSLQIPDKNITRPTTNKIRQAIINALQFDLQGATVLDLFAGSGAVGIECLSAGALSCDFVDSKTAKIVRRNLDKTKLSADVFNLDFKQFLALYAKKYDIIFLDPPYETPFLEQAIEMIIEKDIANNYIVCETSKPDLEHNLVEKSKKKYGDKYVYFLQKGE